jgi:hypothetical protein
LKVVVEREEESSSPKREISLPSRPAIYME